jgi:flotillin
LNASQITQARADAEQNVINQEAEGRAQAARIRAIAQAEAEAIRIKAQALMEAGGAYLDLRRLEMAPELTAQVASALSSSQFVNFGSSGGAGGDHGAVTTASDDVLRVVQTLMAAQIVTGRGLGDDSATGARRPPGSGGLPASNGPLPAAPTRR